jgi:branched-chain amino acid aminotransferase
MSKEWDDVEVNERKITMKELLTAKEDGRLVEMFATGTAAVVTPVGNILYEGKMHAINHSILHSDTNPLISDRIRTTLSDIFYGRVEHPWAYDIEHEAMQTHTELELQDEHQDSIDQYVAYAGQN